MSGHNKWSSIKHKKRKEDAKRGKIFTKIIREITVAAREKGGDPEINPDLRSAIIKAQNANMPKDNIERAIKKGTGELEGVNYEPFLYEGYAPGGVALMIDGLTDNSKRTVSQIRHILTSHNGNLAEKGAVAWNFTRIGSIMIKKNDIDEDEMMMLALEGGAENMETEDEFYILSTKSNEMHNVVSALEEQEIEIENYQLIFKPKNTVPANDNAGQIINIINDLEDLDDVQDVYANFDIDDDVLEHVASDE